jgi:hypothetical protein
MTIDDYHTYCRLRDKHLIGSARLSRLPGGDCSSLCLRDLPFMEAKHTLSSSLSLSIDILLLTTKKGLIRFNRVQGTFSAR